LISEIQVYQSAEKQERDGAASEYVRQFSRIRFIETQANSALRCWSSVLYFFRSDAKKYLNIGQN